MAYMEHNWGASHCLFGGVLITSESICLVAHLVDLHASSSGSSDFRVWGVGNTIPKALLSLSSPSVATKSQFLVGHFVGWLGGLLYKMGWL